MSSPPTRGCSGLGGLGQDRRTVLPADAGVFRFPACRRSPRPGPPRRRGGVPGGRRPGPRSRTSSPPTRGCSAAREAVIPVLAVVPAATAPSLSRSAPPARRRHGPTVRGALRTDQDPGHTRTSRLQLGRIVAVPAGQGPREACTTSRRRTCWNSTQVFACPYCRTEPKGTRQRWESPGTFLGLPALSSGTSVKQPKGHSRSSVTTRHSSRQGTAFAGLFRDI